MRPTIIILIIAGVYKLASCEAYNILAIVPIRTRSHFMVIETLLKGLANKGHNVTVVNTQPQKVPVENYHDIDVSQNAEPFINVMTMDFLISHMRDPHKALIYVWNSGVEMCENVLSNNEVKKLINTTQKFDLIFTEIFSSDCFVSFAYKHKVPLASIVTSSALQWMNPRVSNPDNPSYIVNYANNFNSKMSLLERLQNFYFLTFAKIGNYFLSDRFGYGVAKQYFGDDLPYFSQIYENTSLILVNSHFSINQPRPFVPNVIEIGGIHLKEPKSLPEDLQILLDSAHNGAILVSFGSLISISSFPEHIKNSFIAAFSKIPQMVIWKYEKEFENIPSNVILRKWIPQFDILGHKNVRLFITHGGQSSCIEAVHHGVPVIGIPMFADQPGNIMNLVRRGMAIKIDIFDTSTESIHLAIETILNNNSFRENAEQTSQIFKDRESTPLESAIYWIEYVIRHKGAPHLKTPEGQMSFIQLHLLDIIAFLLSIMIALLLVLRKMFVPFLKFITKTLKTSLKKQKKSKCD